MQNPMPINLMPTHEVQEQGWAAEARDKDGHLISTLAFLDDLSINENFKGLGEFITEYEDNDYVVQVFTGRITEKLT